MLFVYAALALVVSAVVSVPQESNSAGLCLSPTCIVTATALMRSMNTTVDPCEDFYEYACGRWIKDNPVPYWTSEWAIVYKMRNEVYHQIIAIFNKGHTRGDPDAVRKVKDVFGACMDQATIETRREKPMMDVLASMGGWPVLETSWNANSFSILDTLIKLNDIGLSPLFVHGVWSGYKKEDWYGYFFQLDQPELNMKREYFTDSRYSRNVDYLKTFAKDMARALGSKASDIDRQMDDMIDFEVELAKLTATWAERKNWDNVYEKLTVDEFETKNTNQFDIVYYINRLLLTANPRSEMATRNTVIINWGKSSFWKGLSSLINRTPSKTVANFLVFNVVYNTVGYLSQGQFGAIVDKFVTPIWGAPRAPGARDGMCSWGCSSDFSWAVGRMYIDNHFTPQAKRTASSMVEDIRNVFIGMLSKVSWMDSTAQNAAVAKARAIKKNIGYPEALMKENEIDAIYSILKAAGNTYYENTLSTWTLQWRGMLLNFGKTYDRDSWSMGPTTVNAYYEPGLNRITVPAAILQVPFYHKDYPKYLNFAGIGYIIGHELTHGFDNSGKEYDLNGNERRWWSDEVIAKYSKKAQCFVKMYNNFYVPEVKKYVNGTLTLNENLADNGGILESYRAYRAYIAKNGGVEEPLLPGLGMDTHQLFYLNSAQIWCGKVRATYAWNWDLKEVHSPMRYRVWGSMINSPGFHKAFKCAKGTKMNPTRGCQMW